VGSVSVIKALVSALQLPAEPPALEEVRRIVRIFRELRNGKTEDGKTQVKSPSSTLSTAEAISVINSGMALAGHFGDGVLRPHDMASGLIGANVKDPVPDQLVWTGYLDPVVSEPADWKALDLHCPAGDGIGKTEARIDGRERDRQLALAIVDAQTLKRPAGDGDVAVGRNPFDIHEIAQPVVAGEVVAPRNRLVGGRAK